VKEPEPEPEPEPESEPEPEPPKQQPSKKKKKKKGKAQQPPKKEEEPAPATNGNADVDSDDEDEREQAARLLGLQTNKKKKDKAPESEFAQVKSKKKKKKGADDDAATTLNGGATITTDPEGGGDPEVMLNLGSDAAIIIGPGGSIIQNITVTSGAKLDILKNTPEPGQNMVRITATSQDAIATAMEMVQTILAEEEARKANSKSVTLGPSDINGSDGVKAIIGRKGATIQEIEKTCAGVKVDANVDGGSVTVKGPKDMVDKAVQLCKNAVFGEAQGNVKLDSRSAVNIIFGKDFGTIRQLQTSTGAKLDIDKETNVLKISGKVEEVAAAKQAVQALLTRCRGVTMEIKAADIGAVYGKAGSNIRQIQDRTGAFVEVNQAAGADVAKCTIMGEPDAVEAARQAVVRAVAREVELKPGEVAETLDLGVGTPAVIGRAGSTVKDLEKTHKVQLNVNSDSNVCRIVGKQANVTSAKEAIQAIIEPILKAEEAKKQADLEAEAGDSTWQLTALPADVDGW